MKDIIGRFASLAQRMASCTCRQSLAISEDTRLHWRETASNFFHTGRRDTNVLQSSSDSEEVGKVLHFQNPKLSI